VLGLPLLQTSSLLEAIKLLNYVFSVLCQTSCTLCIDGCRSKWLLRSWRLWRGL